MARKTEEWLQLLLLNDVSEEEGEMILVSVCGRERDRERERDMDIYICIYDMYDY